MRKTKKICFALLLVVIMATTAALGCAKPAGQSGDSAQIALVTSAAGKNDNGYNQRAIEALNAYGESAGVNVKVVETSDSLTVPEALAQLAKAGVKLIFSLEYDFDALIAGVGGEKPLAEQYPDTTFVIFNANPNADGNGGYKHANVITVLFDVHEGSFLAGYLAVYVNENLDKLFSADAYKFNLDPETNRAIGYIGGNSSEGIFVFTYGYMEGANQACDELGLTYTLLSNHDAGFGDATVGSTFADSCYTAGANIVYSVAGNVGTGVDSKAADMGRLSIEVDANKDAERPGNILTSVLKNTNVPVDEICKAFTAGTMDQLDRLITYSVQSGGAGITDLSTISASIAPEGKETWDMILGKLAEVSAKIASGEIVVTDAQAGEKLNPDKVQHITYTDSALVG